MNPSKPPGSGDSKIGSFQPVPPMSNREIEQKAKLMVWEGKTARQIAQTLAISIPMAHAYSSKWKQVRHARNEDERNIARGLAFETYQRTLKFLEKAENSRTPILVKGEPVLGSDGLPLYYETPQWDVIPSLLQELRETTYQLGEYCHAIGSTGVAEIQSQAKAELQANEMEFKQEHPDLIPGLGFAHNPSAAVAGPVTNFQFMLNPKLPEALQIDRDRLAQKRLEAQRLPVSVDAQPVEVEEVDDPDGSELS